VAEIEKSRIAELEALAEEVLIAQNPGKRIEPAQILRDLRIGISYGDYGTAFDGMLEHRSGIFHVYLNLRRCGRRDSPRARFTLSHELGHFYIDEHRAALASGRALSHGSKTDFESNNPVEREADRFAAGLLLPQSRFGGSLRRAKRGMAGTLDLAKEFGTSITSTALRSLDVGELPCALMKWTDEGLAWKRFSSSFYDFGVRSVITSPKAVPKESPTQRMLSDGKSIGDEILRAGSVGRSWIPAATFKNELDLILIEESVSLGEYGVLTLLYPESGKLPISRCR